MYKKMSKNTFLQILNDIEARKSMGDIMVHNSVGYETIMRCKRALKCINADNVDGINELYYTNSITSPIAQYAKDEIYNRRDEAKQLQKQKESQKQTECEKPENKPNEMLYTLMNMENRYCIVRCENAGVFAGIVKERNGREVTLTDCRRLWYWEGAASCSQLAVDGTKVPEGCKFTVAVPEIMVLDAIEIIPCTQDAEKSIRGVSIWKI